MIAQQSFFIFLGVSHKKLWVGLFVGSLHSALRALPLVVHYYPLRNLFLFRIILFCSRMNLIDYGFGNFFIECFGKMMSHTFYV